MPPRSSSARCFCTGSVTLDTQHVPIQRKAPVLICFNGQGLPTVLNRKRRGRELNDGQEQGKGIRGCRKALLGQVNCSQPSALSLMVLMGDTVLRGEQSRHVPLLHTAAILGVLANITTLHSPCSRTHGLGMSDLFLNVLQKCSRLIQNNFSAWSA